MADLDDCNTDEDTAIGIDLGTTYCCVAVFGKNGKAEVIPNENGKRITPSTVSYTKDERLVGDAAETERVLNPDNTIYNSKRFIGRSFDDPVTKENKSKYPFAFKKQDGKVAFEIMQQQKKVLVTPEEVGAALLNKMKKIAENHLNSKVTKAVITVPAYFNNSQRVATKQASEIAGIEVLRIINEPTAAAMAYGLHTKYNNSPIKHDSGDKNILVYDLGGGTMDVSLLELDDTGNIEVKATSGHTFLGGDDFTRMLFKHFSKRLAYNHSFNISNLVRHRNRLFLACEKVKILLSNRNEVDIDLSSLLPKNVAFKLKITRKEFEEMCMQLFKSTMETVDKVVSDGKISKRDIDEVVLVGGSTRMPKIRKMLKEKFPNSNINQAINPDEAVACGAAIQAAILSGNHDSLLENIVLMDVTPLSLGVNTEGEITSVVIPRNTTIPSKKTKKYETTSNFQTTTKIEILQGK